jgi:hypothetical protein
LNAPGLKVFDLQTFGLGNPMVFGFDQKGSIGVPEPSTWVMMVLGFAGQGLARHVRQSARIR